MFLSIWFAVQVRDNSSMKTWYAGGCDRMEGAAHKFQSRFKLYFVLFYYACSNDVLVIIMVVIIMVILRHLKILK